MALNPDKIYQKLVEYGDEWADKEAAAQILEDNKKTVLAQLMAGCNETSVSAKEAFALRHENYGEHLKEMVDARKAANKARVRYDSTKIFAELKRTESANDRATTRMAP